MEGQAAHKHGDVAINFAGARLLQLHAGQRHIHFFGHQHGQRGMNALAHLAARHSQNHASIGRDFDPAIESDITLRGRHDIRATQA